MSKQACEHVSAHASRSAAACSAAWPGVGSSDAIGIVLCSRRDLHLNTLVVLVIADFLVTSRLRSSSEPCNIICPSLMNVYIHSYIHGTFIPLRQLLLPTVFENNPKIAQTATIYITERFGQFFVAQNFQCTTAQYPYLYFSEVPRKRASRSKQAWVGFLATVMRCTNRVADTLSSEMRYGSLCVHARTRCHSCRANNASPETMLSWHASCAA